MLRTEAPELVFVVPGQLNQLTGGYLYDRHILDGLRARRRPVKLIELVPGFDAGMFAEVSDGTITIVDGLALPELEQVIAAQARRLRLIGLIHHPLAEETGLPRQRTERLAALEAALLPRFRGLLCPSRRTAAAVANYGVSPDRIAVVPPGTAKPKPRRPRPPRRVRALLCVASVIPRKGHAVLVEALRRVRDLHWNLTCVGSLQRHPPTARLVSRMISAAGLGQRIALAGEWPPDRVCRAYRSADVFVLASLHEGYGMAYAEAMAQGLPIIATTAGAIPETVPPDAGLLVPPGDVTALAEAVRRILVQPGLAARLAAGSRAAGARLPEWQQAVEQWEMSVDRIAALSIPP